MYWVSRWHTGFDLNAFGLATHAEHSRVLSFPALSWLPPRTLLTPAALLLLLLPILLHHTGVPTQARERDWANVITAHAGEAAAYTWRLAHFTLGQHALLPPDAPQQQHLHAGPPVSSVGISCCGNFGLVGTEGGRVDRYNLQSGIHRGTYARQQQQQLGVAGGYRRSFWGWGQMGCSDGPVVPFTELLLFMCRFCSKTQVVPVHQSLSTHEHSVP